MTTPDEVLSGSGEQSEAPFGTESEPQATDPTTASQPGSNDTSNTPAPSAEEPSADTADDAHAGPTQDQENQEPVVTFQVTRRKSSEAHPDSWDQYTTEYMPADKAVTFILHGDL